MRELDDGVKSEKEYRCRKSEFNNRLAPFRSHTPQDQHSLPPHGPLSQNFILGKRTFAHAIWLRRLSFKSSMTEVSTSEISNSSPTSVRDFLSVPLGNSRTL